MARRWLGSGTLLSAADIFRVEDPVRRDGTVLYPVLVDGNRGEWTWLAPQALTEVAAVSWLWEAYDSVQPTVSTVTTDTEHGAGALSRRALEVLRDQAVRLLVAGAEPASAARVVRDRARTLQEARPSSRTD